MRKIMVVVLAITGLGLSGCRRDEKIKLEATDESQPTLASTVFAADPKSAMQLTKGFHPVEQNAWRWTLGRFAIAFAPPANSAQNGAALTLKLSIPDAILAQVKRTTLTAAIQGASVGSQTYATAGEHTFKADIPAASLKGEAVTIEFALDPFVAAGSMETRELGVVFVSASLDPK